MTRFVRIQLLLFLALLALAMLSGCTSMVPKEMLCAPVETNDMTDPVKVVTIP